MANEFEVEGLLRLTDELVILLYARELALKDVDGVERGIGPHAALDWPCLLPLLNDVVDLVLNYLILRNNLQLKARYRQAVQLFHAPMASVSTVA